MRRCAACGAEIAFIISRKSGRSIPVNVPAIKVVTRDGDVIDGFISHFATCTTPAAFRKPRLRVHP